MMEADFIRTDLVLLALPAWMSLVLALLATAAWPWAHALLKRKVAHWRPEVCFGIRALIGTFAIWAVFQFLFRFLRAMTDWPLALLALLGALAVEAGLLLYRHERDTIAVRLGRQIVLLRTAALLAMVFVLAEPVIERYVMRGIERHVVILEDVSDSMQFSDPQMSPDELLHLARFHEMSALRGVTLPEEVPPWPVPSSEHVQEASAVLRKLPAEDQEGVQALGALTRQSLVARLLGGWDRNAGLLERLSERYTVHRVQFAARPVKVPLAADDPDGDGEPAAEGIPADWRRRTDLTQALEFVLREIPSGQLAGVALLSDCQHNGQEGLTAAARRLGTLNAPIYPVVFGSRHSPPDVAVADVIAPQTIYAGDRLPIRAMLQFHGVRGKTVRLTLRRGDAPVHEEDIKVTEDAASMTVRLTDTPPEEGGVIRYTVELSSFEGETVLENNVWRFETAVSEDRTNVLLVDSRPRWEFRYLRNLFHARDRSVHLQYVLTQPDEMPDGGEGRTPVRASAARPFGESEADLLPDDPEQWRRFDMIILGDIGPEDLQADAWEMIESSVSERGAALIVIAGPNAMPHRHQNDVLRNLLPIVYEHSDQTRFAGAGDGFTLQLTPEGRRHPVMQLSPSVSQTEQIWHALPLMHWRQPVLEIKPGADMLAYAFDASVGSDALDSGTGTIESLLEKMDAVNRMRQINSLIAVHTYGSGRVMMLNFDRTWRLRYRIGDTYHHRFWGQVINWASGETLRDGGQYVRMGTDRVSYSPDDTVRVLAKIVEPDYKPVTRAQVSVDIIHNGSRIAEQRLTYREGSQGIYEADLGPFADPGQYQLALKGRAVSEALVHENPGVVLRSTFNVETARNPVELGALYADFALAAQLADLSGGTVLYPYQHGLLDAGFGAGSARSRERADITLWDHWLLLVLLLGLPAAEWLLRRKGGLP